MTVASVRLWGRTIGAVSWDADRRLGNFEYVDAFQRSGIQVAPLTMPLSDQIFSFPALAPETFRGLPGLLADSLPDKFGNAVIDAWLAREGKDIGAFTPVERLCYVGTRGMGALEFEPALGPPRDDDALLEVASLVELAGEILAEREGLQASFDEPDREQALRDILSVGTSAGGARAKAIIAWNPDTNEVRSGQVAARPGFAHWLLKFDGVHGDRDRELDVPRGYGQIEYAYYLMAKAAGVEMSECRLLTEGNRRHFMTRRFDRTKGGEKVHMQTLGALAHFDFNRANAYAYEQVFQLMRRLSLPVEQIEQMFVRMVFNVIARNQDDHVKNVAFLMDKAGRWRLSPAYDVTFAYNPNGPWTAQHQLSLNGKRDDFAVTDLEAVADFASLRRGFARDTLERVQEATERWPDFADQAAVTSKFRGEIGKSIRRLV